MATASRFSPFLGLMCTYLAKLASFPLAGLPSQEDGSGAGGYAKEMSKEWFAAAERMLAAEVKDMDVVIGTALIPGKPAPRLVTEVRTRGFQLVELCRPALAATPPPPYLHACGM